MKKIEQGQIDALKQEYLLDKQVYQNRINAIHSMKNQIVYHYVDQDEINSWGEQGWGISPYSYIVSNNPILLSEAEMLEIVTHSQKDEVQVFLTKLGDLVREAEGIGINLIPESVQLAIITRGEKSEIYHLMDVSKLHPSAQKLIDSRGCDDELNKMIEKNTIIPEIQLKWVSLNTKFYKHLSKNEFCVPAQIEMNKSVASSEFKAYVDKFGLWEDAHLSLLEYRDDENVWYYLSRHPHLSKEALEFAHTNRPRSFLIAYMKLAKSVGKKGFLTNDELLKYFTTRDYEFLCLYQKHYGIEKDVLNNVISTFSNDDFFDAIDKGISFYGAEKKLVTEKTQEELLKYFNKVSNVSYEFIETSVLKGYKDIVSQVIHSKNTDSVFNIFIKHKDYANALISYNRLNFITFWEGDKETFEVGFLTTDSDSQEVKKYISKQSLTNKGYKALCERGFEEELRLYYSKWL